MGGARSQGPGPMGGAWSWGVPALGGAWSKEVCLLWGSAWSQGVVPGPGGCLLLRGVWWRLPLMATAAGDMHPTGMRSSF